MEKKILRCLTYSLTRGSKNTTSCQSQILSSAAFLSPVHVTYWQFVINTNRTPKQLFQHYLKKPSSLRVQVLFRTKTMSEISTCNTNKCNSNQSSSETLQCMARVENNDKSLTKQEHNLQNSMQNVNQQVTLVTSSKEETSSLIGKKKCISQSLPRFTEIKEPS